MPKKTETKTHQDLIDELVEKLQKYNKLGKQKNSVLEELRFLQEELHDAGIDYNIPIEDIHIPSKGSISKATTETPSVKLSYETVLKAADEIMESGRAVSAGTLARKLNVDKRNQIAISQYLQQAVNEDRYEIRKEPMYAFKRKFTVFCPRDKNLPFLPPEVSMKEYEIMLEKSKDALDLIQKDEFTQQEFYKILKPLGEKEGIGAKKMTMTVPSILGTYVNKGVLETANQNTYRKTYQKV